MNVPNVDTLLSCGLFMLPQKTHRFVLAVHLVCANMDKAPQNRHMGPRGLEHHMRAEDVAMSKAQTAPKGIVDMRLVRRTK